MELSALTRSELIFIDPPHTSPDAVIRHMSSALFECGLITNNEDFIAFSAEKRKDQRHWAKSWPSLMENVTLS